MATKKSQSEFQLPGSDVPDPERRTDDQPEFESPDDPSDLADEEAQVAAEELLASVDPRLLSVKAELEKVLAQAASEGGGAQSLTTMEANMVGVGIGWGDAQGTTLSVPGEPVLEVYTLEPESASETKARLAAMVGAADVSASDFPLNVVHTGVIDAQPHRMRLRAAPGGISCGHHQITAGTLGCLVRGRTSPRNARLMILSNNHVLANTNGGPIGASVLQPGPYDGGKHPADQVAILERYVPINFAANANNTVDCATAWAWPDRVRRELMYLTNGAVRLFKVGATPVSPTLGLGVGKTGRTTQLTRGAITAVAVTVNVSYGSHGTARFINQFAVRSGSGNFSAGGDSGSLIWTWDGRRAPVGLLFAGGGGTTFANPIRPVLAALDVVMVT